MKCFLCKVQSKVKADKRVDVMREKTIIPLPSNRFSIKKYDAGDLGLFMALGCCLTLLALVCLLGYANSMSSVNTSSSTAKMMPSGNFTTLVDSVKEYVGYTKTFYKYNASNRNATLTFEQLKEQGGVCWQYAEYYVALGLQDNYTATTFIFNVDPINAHEVAMIANSDGYCIIDQIIYHCQELEYG